nr:hypothetical protein CFP56_32283 [Quercus suber]
MAYTVNGRSHGYRRGFSNVASLLSDAVMDNGVMNAEAQYDSQLICSYRDSDVGAVVVTPRTAGAFEVTNHRQRPASTRNAPHMSLPKYLRSRKILRRRNRILQTATTARVPMMVKDWMQ